MNLLRIAARIAASSGPLSDRPDYGDSGASVPRGDESEPTDKGESLPPSDEGK